MLQTVYIDLGNVLLFFSHEKMCHQIAAISGLSDVAVREVLFTEKLFYDYELGNLTSDAFYQLIAEKAPRRFSREELFHAFTNIFTPNDTMFDVIEKLKKQKLRLILVSNICPCHYKKASAEYSVFHHFDKAVLSFEVRALKPDPLFYKQAIEAAHAPLSSCFYIDDEPSFVEGAKKIGLPAEVFLSASHFIEHLKQRGVSLK